MDLTSANFPAPSAPISANAPSANNAVGAPNTIIAATTVKSANVANVATGPNLPDSVAAAEALNSPNAPRAPQMAAAIENSSAATNAANHDQAEATVKIVMPLKTLARMAAENPEIFAQTKISFARGEAIIEFANGDNAGKFQIALQAANENSSAVLSASREISLVLAMTKNPADSAAGATTAAVGEPRIADATAEAPENVSAKTSAFSPNFSPREILWRSQWEFAGQKFSLPTLALSPQDFAAIAPWLDSEAPRDFMDFTLPPAAKFSANSAPPSVTPFPALPNFKLPLPAALISALTAHEIVIAEQNPNLTIDSEPLPAANSGAENSLKNNLNRQPPDGISPDLRAALRENVRDLPARNPEFAELKLRWHLPAEITLRGEWRAQNLTAANETEFAAADFRSAVDRQIARAGLTPSLAVRAAAAALSGENLPVDRGSIQILLAAAAGRTRDERPPILRAAAHLLKINAPVSVAVAAGQAQWRETQNVVADKLLVAVENLASALPRREAPEFPPARETAKNLAAPEVSDTAANRSLSRTAATALTAAIQELRDLPLPADSADLPAKLQNFFTSFAREKLARAMALVERAAAQILREHPQLPRLDSALTAILARLNNEPEKKLLSAAEILPSDKNPPLNNFPAKFLAGNSKFDFSEWRRQSNGNFPAAAEWSNFARGAAARPAHPGIEKFPVEWQEVLPNSAAKTNLPLMETALREIFAENSRSGEAQSRLENLLRGLDRPTLRELAATLQALERDEIAAHPALPKLAAAAAELRDLGRIFTAMKMENLANEQQNSPLLSATIPFTMNGKSEGEGKLQMFYHRGGGKKNWSSRVVLDLDLSALGDLVGDLRFMNDKKLSLVIGVKNAAACQTLAADREALVSGLSRLGFYCQPDFRVVESPPPAPAKISENLAEARRGENSPPTQINRGRIDVKI